MWDDFRIQAIKENAEHMLAFATIKEKDPKEENTGFWAGMACGLENVLRDFKNYSPEELETKKVGVR